jgi:hypothetical protein
MPRVTFRVDGDESSRVSRSMMTPPKMYSLHHWYKAARIAVPKVPDPTDHNEWALSHTVATERWIVFTLSSVYGGPQAKVIIDRKADTIGF